MSIKRNILVVALVACIACANAQSVNILDLSITEDVTQTMNNTPNDSIDSIYLRVSFKIDNPQDADTLYVLFGTHKNAPNVALTQGAIIEQGGNYFTYNNGPLIPIESYTAVHYIWMKSTDYKNCSDVTLYVKQKNGSNTGRIYYQK